MTGRVVIIGSGIIGACCAIEALRDGWAVTILEPGEPGGTQAASYGNGGWISPASIIPMSMPGLWRKVPGYLLDRLGPLTIDWHALPTLAPWLIRFIWAGATEAKVTQTARSLNLLMGDAPERHLALAAEAGVAHLIERRGLLYAYPSRTAFLTEALAWKLRRQNGVSWTELNDHELAAAEPDLDPHYRFGVRVDGGAHCLDPGGYVSALVAHAISCGANLVRGQASGFHVVDGKLLAVQTSAGALPCTHAVIAAGIASAALARNLGDHIPLASERGYHVQLAASAIGPRTPMMPSDGKMALTPMAHGLRSAGQVQLADAAAKPNWHRAEILLDHLRHAFPSLPMDRLGSWMGNRPSTPDGLPVIGASPRVSGVVHAFGHGHVGLASGPATGRLVADALAGRAVPGVFAPARFGKFAVQH